MNRPRGITAGQPDMIPREVLFGNPVKANPKISPDGSFISYLAPVNNVLNIMVKSVNKDDDRAVTCDSNRGIRRYFWGRDSKRIFYLKDRDGDENWRLYDVDLDTLKERDLTPFENARVDVLGHDKFVPDGVLIAMNRENPMVHDVYYLDIKTGEISLKNRNPGDVAGWVADADLMVRGAVVTTSDGGSRLMIRGGEEEEWRELDRWDMDESMTSSPLHFSRDGRFLYIADSNGSDTTYIKKTDLTSGKSVIVARDETCDAGAVFIDPDTRLVQAVCFTRERDEWVVIDDSIKEDFRALRCLAPGDFFICDRNADNDIWLAGFNTDKGPVSFYMYDRKTKKGTFLFSDKPDLKKYRLAEMEDFSFSARDGLRIHGYITYPAGSSKKDLPLVLNVHGGPWHRDTWGYNAEAQWLANRGYVCMQVNYRGSTGYGKKFLNASIREWGGKMQDDLTDAVRWAVAEGIALPGKVAIYGGSYGGYAALAGAAFTPDVFCCAVDIVGPSNLITFIKTIPPYWSTFLAMMRKRVGDPDTEEEMLISRSPLFSVKDIKIPMLIAQGANDPRVKQSESEQIVEEMRRKNIEHKYLLFPDEGHGFAKPANRMKFYKEAEAFLAEYLGGRYE
ncbi:MAG: S9 family peptidase [Candidatus Omnitrophota bacterium]